MATRIKVPPERLAALFDFSIDPFTFAAVHVDGKSVRERALRVAILVAARSYLATGRWSGDWAEIKAMCTHQNCYDVNNFSGTLKAAEGDWFKKVATGSSVQTSAKGQKEAERLLAALAALSMLPKSDDLEQLYSRAKKLAAVLGRMRGAELTKQQIKDEIGAHGFGYLRGSERLGAAGMKC